MKSLRIWRTWTMPWHLWQPADCWRPAENVRLLRPDTLVGWEYGRRSAGRLDDQGRPTCAATPRATPTLVRLDVRRLGVAIQLVGLRRWHARAGLSTCPTGAGLQLTLAEGEHCGRVRDGGKELATGGKIDPLSGGAMHTADHSHVRRHAHGDRRPQGRGWKCRSTPAVARAWPWRWPGAKPRSLICGPKNRAATRCSMAAISTAGSSTTIKGTWTVDGGDIIPTVAPGAALSADRAGICQLHAFARIHDLARAATQGSPFARPRTAGPQATAWSCKSSISPARSKTRRWPSMATCRRWTAQTSRSSGTASWSRPTAG